MTKTAILLINLGSPDDCSATAVSRYLDEFLMDPWVLQMPWLLRRLLVSLFVLPSRPKESAKAYQQIWTNQGSPLIVNSLRLRQKLQQQLERPVFMAMRYGNPSIESQLLAIAEDPAVSQVEYIPLYPHFADSTVTTSIKEAERVIRQHKLSFNLKVHGVFYQDPDYIRLLAAQIKTSNQQNDAHDSHLLFSYHGLPELHIKKADRSKNHCLKQADCCHQASSAHQTCYRHQVFKTTQQVVNALGLSPQDYSVAFQSRLGRAKWLEPSCEGQLAALAQQGIKHLTVICPAFVTDCLETLEEIGIRGREIFIQAGGESFHLVPCLNSQPGWVELLGKWIKKTHCSP